MSKRVKSLIIDENSHWLIRCHVILMNSFIVVEFPQQFMSFLMKIYNPTYQTNLFSSKWSIELDFSYPFGSLVLLLLLVTGSSEPV